MRIIWLSLLASGLTLLTGCTTNTTPSTTTIGDIDKLRFKPITRLSRRTHEWLYGHRSDAWYGDMENHRDTPIRKIGGQVLIRGTYHRIILPMDHLFQNNLARFKPEAEAALEQAANVISMCPKAHVIVVACHDHIYSRYFDKSLADARANAVVASLWSHGISDVQQHPFAGQRRWQVALNNRIEGFAMNRRIEIIF